MSQFLTLAKARTALVAIPARRFIAFGAGGDYTLATTGTAKIVGVSPDLDTPAGRRCDALMSGFQSVDAGGAISWGDYLTADATGRAVVAGPGDRISAMAMQGAATGDPLDILIVHGIA